MASVLSQASCNSATQLRSGSSPLLTPLPARRSVCCRCATESPAASSSRRASLAALLTIPVLASVPAAQAILPTQDDEDEELISKAKSGRKARIQSELTTEKTFSKENYNDMAILTVARAVKKIAKSGEQLEKGDLKGVATQVGGKWVGDFKKVVGDLSKSDAAKSSFPAIFKEITALASAAGSGNSQAAKKEFVDTVTAIQTWAGQAGITSQLAGL